MSLKWMGAVMVVVSCGGFGFATASAHRARIQSLKQFLRALDCMESTLTYKLTPLPQLCEQTAHCTHGTVRRVLLALTKQLHSGSCPDAQRGMDAVLEQLPDIPRDEALLFRQLGSSLGRFDLPGQLKGLQSIREECTSALQTLKQNQKERLRSYQTLGLCAGAALVILFI